MECYGKNTMAQERETKTDRAGEIMEKDERHNEGPLEHHQIWTHKTENPAANEHGAAVTVRFRGIHRPVTSMTKTTLQTRFGLEQPLKHGDTEENDEEYAKKTTKNKNKET